MAKPYLIFKAHTGFNYAQIRLADGSLSNNKFTDAETAQKLNGYTKETANGKSTFSELLR